jgi:hypothetical protein
MRMTDVTAQKICAGPKKDAEAIVPGLVAIVGRSLSVAETALPQ